MSACTWGALPGRITPVDAQTCTVDLCGDWLPYLPQSSSGWTRTTPSTPNPTSWTTSPPLPTAPNTPRIHPAMTTMARPEQVNLPVRTGAHFRKP